MNYIFDYNNKTRIAEFLSLKDKCMFHESKIFGPLQKVNNNNLPFLYYASYFSNVRDVCDLSLLFLINEEISNISEREKYPDLIIEITEGKLYKKHIYVNGEKITLPDNSLEIALSELREMLVNKFNGLMGSHMLDFMVSIFSTFEFWISKLYIEFEGEFTPRLMSSRKNKYIKLIDKYSAASNQEDKNLILEKIIKLQGGYISFPDKINSILKKVNDTGRYNRDIKKDRELIDYLRASRNTVHNGGVHTGNTIEFNHNDIGYKLEKDKPIYSENHNDYVLMLGELTDIYSEIIGSILHELKSYDAYIYTQSDEVALHIFKRIVDDYCMSEKQTKETETDFFAISMEKLGFNLAKSKKIHACLDELLLNNSCEANIFEKLLACKLY